MPHPLAQDVERDKGGARGSFRRRSQRERPGGPADHARDESAATALFDHLFTYAKRHVLDYNEIELIQPPIPRVRDFCAARGFRSWEQEEDFLVYEYPGG